MPYKIDKRGPEDRPYRVIRKADGKVVGTSKSLAKAKAHIAHRESGESMKKKKDKERKGDSDLREDLRKGVGEMLDEHGVFDGGKFHDSKKAKKKKAPKKKKK